MYAITEKLSEHLKSARFRVRAGETMGVPSVRFIATKTIFVPVGITSVNIVAIEKDKAKPHDADNLADIGFTLAKRMNRVPLLRGMSFVYVIVPLIIGKDPDLELLLYASSAPGWWRFGMGKLPVVVDLTSSKTVFFEGWDKVGGAIIPSIQKIVTKHIEPAVNAELNQ